MEPNDSWIFGVRHVSDPNAVVSENDKYFLKKCWKAASIQFSKKSLMGLYLSYQEEYNDATLQELGIIMPY
jgi:hypothetical protein